MIVSTGRSPAGDTVLRIRDSGEGLNEKAIEAALTSGPRRPPDPRDASTWEGGARGAGLALVSALAEANRAQFTITSKPHQGSLFELVFLAQPERSPARPPALEDVAARSGMDGTDGRHAIILATPRKWAKLGGMCPAFRVQVRR